MDNTTRGRDGPPPEPDTAPGEQNRATSNQEDVAEISQQVPQTQIQPPKRAQVLCACQTCRRKKQKCDARRPCSNCARRGVACVYKTQDGETRFQAVKRRYDETLRSRDLHEELFHMLATRSRTDAAEIVRRVRLGHSAGDVLEAMKVIDATLELASSKRALTVEIFLVNLAHSTGSLGEIIRLATAVLDPRTKLTLPKPADFAPLHNRVVRLPAVETLLQRSQPSLPAAASNDDGGLDDANKVDSPPHSVPAAPWTTIEASDEAVSHLVSIFCAWINPTWRFIEEDLFVKGMRSKQLNSTFCSPFLVNSICAIASMQSEAEVAFSDTNGERVARGQHFRDEALRLWVLEENRPTLTNIQALCVLSLDSNYRAKDRFGLSLLPIAAQLNSEISVQPDEAFCAAQSISMPDYTRARVSTYWTMRCTQIIMYIAFMSGASVDPRLPGVPKIHDTFDDKISFWVGYPLTNDLVAFRPTLYLRERCRLAELFQEMHNLICANDERSNVTGRDFVYAVDRLAAKMQHWYQNLPFELQYKWPMSVAVWELHASYLAFLMILWLSTSKRLQQEQEQGQPDDEAALPERDEEGTNLRLRMAQERLSSAILLSYQAAQMLRDFREEYGLKVTPAWLLQLQAVTAGVLVLDPALVDRTSVASPTAAERLIDGVEHAEIKDSPTAYDETFRSLLGSGNEVMVARAIARMMYHTAREQGIALSQPTRMLLQIMSDTAWRPSDLSLVNSTFPNFATTQGYEDRERMSELLARWEKLEI